MVVCKYFVEGYCKFGTRCKFDHVDPYRGYESPRSGDYPSERPQGTSILKAASSSFGGQEYTQTPQHSFIQPQQHGFNQQNFSQTSQHSYNQSPQHGFSSPAQQGNFVQKPTGSKYNIQEMMQIVMRDIAQLEKGGQWQLSCYSPIKELPNLPGLDDYSQEELRWECYKALQNGSLPLCQAIVQQLFGNVAKINNELKRKDTGFSIIDRWLRDSERLAQNAMGQPASTAFTSPFGGNNVATSALSSPFFASEAQVQQQPQQQSASSSFSFSLSPQQPVSNANPFQQSSSVFSTNQTSPFGSSNQTSAFAPSSQTSAFAPSSQTSAFAPSSQTSAFAPSSQTSAFAPSSPTSAFPYQSASPFSSPLRTQSVDNQARSQVVDSQVYSTNEMLSEIELKAFQADRFTLGSIPTKPPPRALCNL